MFTKTQIKKKSKIQKLKFRTLKITMVKLNF